MNGQFKKLSDFVDWLVELELEQEGSGAVHWFRGHPHRNLQLRPGALRDPLAGESPAVENRRHEEALERHERTINQQFRREAASLVTDPVDLVELYFLAQHHGLPTRLLDWTTNGLAALFFTAVQHPDEDGEVIVTSPTWRLTIGDAGDPRVKTLEAAPFPQHHPLVVQTIRSLFGDDDCPDDGLILPVLPDLRSRRMLQQGACFTLHQPGSDAIRDEAVVRLVIPRALKTDLVASLRTLGITWSTLFPDLDHLCLDLRTRWREGMEGTRS